MKKKKKKLIIQYAKYVNVSYLSLYLSYFLVAESLVFKKNPFPGTFENNLNFLINSNIKEEVNWSAQKQLKSTKNILPPNLQKKKPSKPFFIIFTKHKTIKHKTYITYTSLNTYLQQNPPFFFFLANINT